LSARVADDAEAIRRMEEIAAERSRALQSVCFECGNNGWIWGGEAWTVCSTCKNPDQRMCP
jgi:rubrerythrin